MLDHLSWEKGTKKWARENEREKMGAKKWARKKWARYKWAREKGAKKKGAQ